MSSFDDLVEQADRAAQEHLGGETVTYNPDPTVGASVQVTGMFSEEFFLADGNAPVGVEVSGPAVFFRKSDLPGDPVNDEPPVLTIRGAQYNVTRRIPDDKGGIVFLLRLKEC